MNIFTKGTRTTATQVAGSLPATKRQQRFSLWLVGAALLMGMAACSNATPPPAAATAPTPAPATEAATEAPTAAPVAAEPAIAVPRPEVVAEGGASTLDPQARNEMYTAAPEMVIDPSKFYYATLKTARGDIKVQLFADRAPLTVNNFVFLAREGFYNDTIFHRVLDGFMAQAGDPTGTGMGGPGYEFADEIVPTLTFDRPGLLAMANAGPGTNGSQFFITFAPTDWLNGMHTIFGEVIEGQDILNQITRVDPSQPSGVTADTLYTVLIEESDESTLPPPPPTPTPTVTPTPFAATSLESAARPLATVVPAERANYFNVAPEMVIDTAKQYTATMTTSKGPLTIALYDDLAPVAVNNFVVLSNLGFYDGVPINQVSPGELMVIGSPDNQPTSDAGYKIAAETGITGTLEVGAVAYVPFRGITPNHSSSQLLIALLPPPAEANADFSFFGRVVGGEAVLAQLTNLDTIESVTIEEQ
ncbi:MAG: peptidylprolyl isomerase [Caldilineaceae bacterium]|nr:peptidylprolyl isomerase [Caldilineaceae bacterium]